MTRQELQGKVESMMAERGMRLVEPAAEPDAVDNAADRWARFAPDQFQGARLDDLGDDQATAELTGWCERAATAEVGNLLLLGPLGTGKTHAAMAVCRRLIEAGRAVRWWPTVELFDALRPDGELGLFAPTHTEFVLFDDLGAERPSEWVAERLYLIVNRRWLDKRPAIVTSNLEPDSLRDVIGPRAWDRLRDSATAVRLSGGSRRRGR